jgi:hypothetical protein
MISSRILVVDDTPANIRMLSGTLKEKGYQISVATNGKQAFDVGVSTWEASIESETALSRLSNLRLELEVADGADLHGEIYAKVVGQTSDGRGQALIRYTSISTQIKLWLQQITALPAAQTQNLQPSQP